jgi:hypothetical protein
MKSHCIIETHFYRFDLFYYSSNRRGKDIIISVSTSTPVHDNTWRYNVEVIESDGSGSKTNHEVTMNKDYYLAQTGGSIIPEEFVKKSFEFLLEREDKNSILQRFDITQIKDYFPEFEKEIKK